jgi:YVTN family beta-propeller protein
MRLPLRTFVSLCSVVVFLAAFSVAQEEQYVVVERTSSRLKFFSLADGSPRGEARSGANPLSTVVAPGGRIAYQANVNSRYISVIDMVLHKEIRRIQGLQTGFMAGTPDGHKLIALDINRDVVVIFDLTACDNSTCPRTEVSYDGQFGDQSGVVDINVTNVVALNDKVYLNSNPGLIVVHFSGSVTTVPGLDNAVGGRQSLALSPDGTRLLALRRAPNRAFLIDTAADSVLQTAVLSWSTFAIARSDGVSGRFYAFHRVNGSPTQMALAALDLTEGPDFGTVLNDLVLPVQFGFANGNLSRMAVNNADTRLIVTTRDYDYPANFNLIDTTSFTVLDSKVIPHIIQNMFIATVATTNGGAPTISSVSVAQNGSPTTAPVNDQPFTVTINGGGFDGPVVRIGNLDPITPSFVSATQLQVQLPAHVASQGADIIVTTRHVAAPETDLSGFLSGAFVVANPATFRPLQQVVTNNLGEASISVLNASTGTAVIKSIDVNSTALGVTFSPDGNQVFVSNFLPGGVTAADLFNSTMQWFTRIAVGRQAVGADAVGIAPAPGGGALRAYNVSGEAELENELLHILNAADGTDAAPAADTGSVDSSQSYGTVRPTPDGNFIYYLTSDDVSLSANRLRIYDVQANTFTTRDPNSFGFAGAFDSNLTADGAYMLVPNGPGDSIKIVNIGADPLLAAPAIDSVPTVAIPGVTVQLGRALAVGTRLYALDVGNRVLEVFGFDPVHHSYPPMAQYQIPSSPFGTAQDFAVSPDGNTVYVTLSDEDSVAVIDTTNSAAPVLLTTIVTGLEPFSVGIRPGAPTVPGSDVPVNPTPQVSIVFTTVGTPGQTTVTTTNSTTVLVPAGVQFSTIPVIYQVSTTASFSGPVDICFTYDPSMFSGTEGDLRLLHEDNGSFVDVTTSHDLTNHRICGVVDHFSAFAIGIGSTTFLFDSLVTEVQQLNVSAGSRRSLLAKVVAARGAFDRHNPATAISQLSALQNELGAQAGKQISAADAARLSDMVSTLIARLR